MSMNETRKPKCKLVGTDGNVFAIIGRVSQALREDKQPDRAKQWSSEAMKQDSYDAVLQLLHSYVEAY